MVRAFVTAGTVDADVTFIHEPDADGNNHRALPDAIHEPFEHQIEFTFLADLQKQITDKGRVKPYVEVCLHRNNLGKRGRFFNPKGVYSRTGRTFAPNFVGHFLFINFL